MTRHWRFLHFGFALKFSFHQWVEVSDNMEVVELEAWRDTFRKTPSKVHAGKSFINLWVLFHSPTIFGIISLNSRSKNKVLSNKILCGRLSNDVVSLSFNYIAFFILKRNLGMNILKYVINCLFIAKRTFRFKIEQDNFNKFHNFEMCS